MFKSCMYNTTFAHTYTHNTQAPDDTREWVAWYVRWILPPWPCDVCGVVSAWYVGRYMDEATAGCVRDDTARDGVDKRA